MVGEIRYLVEEFLGFIIKSRRIRVVPREILPLVPLDREVFLYTRITQMEMKNNEIKE